MIPILDVCQLVVFFPNTCSVVPTSCTAEVILTVLLPVLYNT